MMSLVMQDVVPRRFPFFKPLPKYLWLREAKAAVSIVGKSCQPRAIRK